jgi:hypothetical protein
MAAITIMQPILLQLAIVRWRLRKSSLFHHFLAIFRDFPNWALSRMVPYVQETSSKEQSVEKACHNSQQEVPIYCT